MTRSLHRALVGLALAASPALAQDTDYSLTDVRVLQILEDHTLIADRPVTVRAMLDVDGPGGDVIDALLRVYVNGVEAADSPIFSLNGPKAFSGSSSPNLGGSMLNFAYIPPASNNVVFEVELNPAGPTQVPETDFGNNVLATAPQTFRVQELLTLMYSPIDYRPGGGSTPNLPDNELIKPGVGDAFVQGIFPGGTIEYRRTDAPSKLWTGSLNSSGSSLNSSLTNDLFLTSPQPDYIYGWVPGSLPYNGMAFINGVASMGNTQSVRHQRTYAHELGHNFGQSHNGLGMGVYGEDVERHLNEPLGLKKIKVVGLNDIMVAGQLTDTAWIHQNIFNQFLNHPDLALPLPPPSGQDSAPLREHLLVSGRWDRASGGLTLDPLLTVLAEEGSRPAAPAQADVLLSGLVDGQRVGVFPLTVRSSADEGPCVVEAGTDSGAPADPVIHFNALIPATAPDGRALQGLVVEGSGTHPLQARSLQASEHAPEVVVTAPVAGVPTGDTVRVAWQASDADGDDLSATVRYVVDGARHIVPIAVHTQASEVTVDLTGLPHFVPGAGHFEVSVSDGFRTTRARSAALTGPGAYAGAGGSPPFVDIYHPDDGLTFRKGAPLILHSSGWDLEDDALNGASISWSSDVDGFLATGRRLIYPDLSVGVHDITVTATDSGGQQTSATHTIEVIDRQLPAIDGTVCATDLGFGGPGSAVVSLCGEDLTTGGDATLTLSGAPASTLAVLVYGLTNAPVPFKGGQLVPVPWAGLISLNTDVGGGLVVPNVNGGGAHFTLFLQFVVVDGGQPEGFALSNALQAEF